MHWKHNSQWEKAWIMWQQHCSFEKCIKYFEVNTVPICIMLLKYIASAVPLHCDLPESFKLKKDAYVHLKQYH